jgi:ABC-type multidrug transport system fused ATPase/permease subunit
MSFLALKLADKLRMHSVSRSFQLLSNRAKKTFILVGLAQVALGLLDLLAILIIGVIGSLAVAGISGFEAPSQVTTITQLIRISDYSFQKQIGILGLLSAAFLITKTLMSMWITKRTLGFLSNQGRQISIDLLERVLKHPNIKIALPDTQKTIFVFARGVSEISVGLLGSVLNITADLSLLIILVIGLMLIDPTMAIFSFLLFASLALALYGLLHKQARQMGQQEAMLSIKTNNFLMDLTSILEQIRIRNLESQFIHEYDILQKTKSRNDAEIAFLPLIGKYVLEAGVVFGAILLCALEFMFKNSQAAVASLAIFLTAGTRITPALLRLQQSSMKLKLTHAISGNVFELISDLKNADSSVVAESSPAVEDFPEKPFLSINQLTFAYPANGFFTLDKVNLELERGQVLSIVGPSGSGKSTLASVIVGSLIPNDGVITIQNDSPGLISKKFPGFIGYVPQQSSILEGSLAQNISLTPTVSDQEISRILECIEIAQLTALVSKLPSGINTDLRASGITLSGGEQQRLGIARALFSSPSLLVLDEATSALDGETEFLVSQAIQSLRGQLTIVLIAHRLSTVRNSDKIIYLDNGRVVASGTFEQLRVRVPSFDKQAGLMGF